MQQRGPVVGIGGGQVGSHRPVEPVGGAAGCGIGAPAQFLGGLPSQLGGVGEINAGADDDVGQVADLDIEPLRRVGDQLEGLLRVRWRRSITIPTA